MTEDRQQDQVANRLALVPSVGVYSAKPASIGIRGRAGVTASNITGAPSPTADEPNLGMWSMTGTALTATIGPSDLGPRSGTQCDYESSTIAEGKHVVMVSTEALLGVVKGRTAWGESAEKSGRLLVWKWKFDDIDEISVNRLKKMFKMWDTELVLKCNDPAARLHFSAYGQESDVFRAYDDIAKGKKRDGSNLLAFAHTLAEAIAGHRACTVLHTADDDPKEPGDTFRFA